MAAIHQKMQDVINKQIGAEWASAWLYLSMSSYFDSINLGGFGHWLRAQAQEEIGHAMKFATYLTEREGRVVYDAIDKPQAQWDSPLAAMQAVYAHEQKVTALIGDMVAVARDLNDHATESLLRWFVDEQVEEESSAKTIVEQLKMIGGSTGALFMLNARLGERS